MSQLQFHPSDHHTSVQSGVHQSTAKFDGITLSRKAAKLRPPRSLAPVMPLLDEQCYMQAASRQQHDTTPPPEAEIHVNMAG
eukprot:2967270-Amphidinium_carterae.1